MATRSYDLKAYEPYRAVVGQDWWARHQAALRAPDGAGEAALVLLASGVSQYVTVLSWQAGDGPTGDYVLSPAIGQVLQGILGLLNGNVGRLDQGTVDGWCREIAAVVGFCLDHDGMASECRDRHEVG